MFLYGFGGVPSGLLPKYAKARTNSISRFRRIHYFWWIDVRPDGTRNIALRSEQAVDMLHPAWPARIGRQAVAVELGRSLAPRHPLPNQPLRLQRHGHRNVATPAARAVRCAGSPESGRPSLTPRALAAAGAVLVRWRSSRACARRRRPGCAESACWQRAYRPRRNLYWTPSGSR